MEEVDDLGCYVLHSDLHQSECQSLRQRGQGDLEEVWHQRTGSKSSATDIPLRLRFWMRTMGAVVRRAWPLAHTATESVPGEYLADSMCAGAKLWNL
jgi:hypothetical protein